jgi:hypothetical protein
LPELANVWAAHASVKNQKILAVLLTVYAACLETRAPLHAASSRQPSESSKAPGSEHGYHHDGSRESTLSNADGIILQAFQQHTASFVIKNKMKVMIMTFFPCSSQSLG